LYYGVPNQIGLATNGVYNGYGYEGGEDLTYNCSGFALYYAGSSPAWIENFQPILSYAYAQTNNWLFTVVATTSDNATHAILANGYPNNYGSWMIMTTEKNRSSGIYTHNWSNSITGYPTSECSQRYMPSWPW
jgi:hypothetical protein